MDAFLAQTSSEGLSHTATLVVSLAMVLGILALCCYCVAKAIQWRTTSWIVAGVVGGFVGSLILIGLAAGFTKGLRNAMQQSEAADPQLDGATTTSSRPAATELVRGRDMAYSIRVPAAWTTRRAEAPFDTLSNFKSLYVGVIAEEAELGTPEIIAELVRRNITEVATDIHWDEPEALALDGRRWLQFSVDCVISKIPFTYEYYLYSGREGTYQVVGWTARNLYERDAPLLRDVMQTFRFPE